MRLLMWHRATATEAYLHQVQRSFRTCEAKHLINESLDAGCVAGDVLKKRSEPLRSVEGTAYLFALLACYVSCQKPLNLCRSSV